MTPLNAFSEVVDERRRWTADWYSWLTGLSKLVNAPVVTTVSGLSSASGAGAGTRAFVTDSNSAVFNAVVAGGGSNKVPVVSDGTNWLIG